MPEGPSILMLGELARAFVGRTVRSASGSARMDLDRLSGRRLLEVRTWGKHLLLRFSGFTVRIHLLLFGSYRINERKDRLPTLSLSFSKDELNFYASAVKVVEGDLEQAYDWRVDVLSDAWDPALARRKLAASPRLPACDALLDQDSFAGVGNIIKNEVLFRLRLHPLREMGELTPRQRARLVSEARQFSFDFLAWRRVGALKRNLLAHGKKRCAHCALPLQLAILGKRKRRAFWCENCQPRHPEPATAPKATKVATKPKPPKPSQARSKRIARN